MVELDHSRDQNDEGMQELQTFISRTVKLGSLGGRLHGYNVKPRPDDVVITTPPKSGTTWVSQIVQSLRSRGDLSFQDINLVIPFIEMNHDADMPSLDREQGFAPRVFKSHYWYDHCPKGARYIIVVRDPQDVAPSFYYFLRNWVFDGNKLDMDTFVKGFLLDSPKPADPTLDGPPWHWIASWYPHRNASNVLWLHYEDLAADTPECVRLIADFLGLGDDLELQQIALEQASIETMKKNSTKYDEHIMKHNMNTKMGLPKDAGFGAGTAGKVREGKVGTNSQELSLELREAIQQRWEEFVTPVTGAATYAEMRAAINKEQGRHFHV